MTSAESSSSTHSGSTLANSPRHRNTESTQYIKGSSHVNHENQVKSDDVYLPPEQAKYIDTIGPAIAKILSLSQENQKTNLVILDLLRKIVHPT